MSGVTREPERGGRLVRLIDAAERHRVAVLVVLFALAAAGAVSALWIPIQNAPEAYLSKDDPVLIGLEQFHRYFGEERILAVTVSMPGGVLTEAGIRELRTTTRMLEEAPGVSYVTSLATVEAPVRQGDALRLGPVLPSPPVSREDIARAKEALRGKPRLREALLSADGKVTTYLLRLGAADGHWGQPERDALLADVRAKLARSGVSPRAHLVGLDPFIARSREGIQHDCRTTLGLGALLGFVVLLVLLRHPLAVVLVFAPAVVSLCLTLGVYRLSGRPLTTVTALLPILIIVYALGDALHVYHHLQTAAARRCRTAGRAVAAVVPACIFTSLTTGIGFGSLALSEVWPVRDFGLLTAAGVSLAFVTDLFVLPLLLRAPWVRRRLEVARAGNEVYWVRAVAAQLGRTALRHPVAVALVVAGLILPAVHGIRQLTPETNFLLTYSPDDPVRRDVVFHDAHLAGALRGEILLEAERPGTFRTAAGIRKLAALQRAVDAQPTLSGSVSIADFVRDAAGAVGSTEGPASLPASDGEVAELLLLASFARGGLAVDDFVTADGRRARVSVRASFTGTKALLASRAAVIRDARAIFGAETRVHATGSGWVIGGSLQRIVNGFQESCVTAVVLVALVFLAITRSFAWTVVALFVNLLPIALCYSVHGWWMPELGMTGFMFGAVAFGIAVDDTLHILSAIARTGGGSSVRGVLRAVRETGPGVVATSFALAGGFACGLSSSFPPTVTFSALLMLAMGWALLSDVMLLPVLAAYLPLPPLRGFGGGGTGDGLPRALSDKDGLEPADLQPTS